MYRNFSDCEQTFKQKLDERKHLKEKRDLLLIKRLEKTFRKFKLASQKGMRIISDSINNIDVSAREILFRNFDLENANIIMHYKMDFEEYMKEVNDGKNDKKLNFQYK